MVVYPKSVAVKAHLHLGRLILMSGFLLSSSLLAGNAPVDSKEVASVCPAPCDWNGFYLGANAGGQFGRSENRDLGNYNHPDLGWSYGESGFVGGGQFGFNWQRRWLVLGAEVENGFMNLDGRGKEPGFPGDTYGQTDSDFFATFRGRVGIAYKCCLFYATGGAIAVDYHTSVTDHVFSQNGPDTLDASREHFDWGYTVGGGVERMFQMCGRRWSVKLEYLYFNLQNQNFSAVSDNGGGPYGWSAETEGHIVRAGLNYHF